MSRIKYECSICGWHASIPSEWADIKPTYCGNSKCAYSKARAPKSKKSFALDPTSLNIHRPKEDSSVLEKKVVKRRKSKENVEDVQRT